LVDPQTTLRYYALHDLLDADAAAQLATAKVDAYIAPLLTALVDTQSITLFTFLFGIGFALQFSPAIDRGWNPRNFYYDGRGAFNARVFGLSADIGGYEWNGVDTDTIFANGLD
jgi:uncharacterized membrane protein YeiB